MKIMSFVVAAAIITLSNNVLADTKAGNQCLPRLGSTINCLVNGHFGIGNNNCSGAVDVMCGIDKVGSKIAGVQAQVYVSRGANSGGTPLTCTLYSSSENALTVLASSTGSTSRSGESVIALNVSKSNANSHYYVSCSLPRDGGVRSIYYKEN